MLGPGAIPTTHLFIGVHGIPGIFARAGVGVGAGVGAIQYDRDGPGARVGTGDGLVLLVPTAQSGTCAPVIPDRVQEMPVQAMVQAHIDPEIIQGPAHIVLEQATRVLLPARIVPVITPITPTTHIVPPIVPETQTAIREATVQAAVADHTAEAAQQAEAHIVVAEVAAADGTDPLKLPLS